MIQVDRRNGEGGGERKSPPPLVHRTDLILALLVLGVAGGLYFSTTGFEVVPDIFAQDIPPEFFPRMIIWTIVILALPLPFEYRFLWHRGKDLDKERHERIRPMAFATVAFLVVAVSSTVWLGTYGTMLAVCILMPLLWGERRLGLLAAYAAIFPALVTLLFSRVLGVHFEPGVIGALLG